VSRSDGVSAEKVSGEGGSGRRWKDGWGRGEVGGGVAAGNDEGKVGKGKGGWGGLKIHEWG